MDLVALYNRWTRIRYVQKLLSETDGSVQSLKELRMRLFSEKVCNSLKYIQKSKNTAIVILDIGGEPFPFLCDFLKKEAAPYQPECQRQ